MAEGWRKGSRANTLCSGKIGSCPRAHAPTPVYRLTQNPEPKEHTTSRSRDTSPDLPQALHRTRTLDPIVSTQG